MSYNYLLTLLLIIIIISLYLNIHESFSNLVHLNSIVDKIYVINLKKDRYRLDILEPKLNKLNIKYEIINGIDGETVVNHTKMRTGQYGCLLSHIKILKDAHKNRYNNIAILEDDIIFNKQFNHMFDKKYRYLLKKENEYDILYLGSSQGYYHCKKKKWKDVKLNNHYYKVKDTLGTFAFIINKKIIKNILDQFEQKPQPIDNLINEHIIKNPLYKCFALYPNIITANVSNISNTSKKKRSQVYFMKLNNINPKHFDM